jgi:hypothetical protein
VLPRRRQPPQRKSLAVTWTFGAADRLIAHEDAHPGRADPGRQRELGQQILKLLVNPALKDGRTQPDV